jgi:hypothetical protein
MLKRAGKKRVGLKNSWPILPKVPEKGPKKISKEVPYFTVMTNTQRQRQNLIYISTDPWVERCIDIYITLPEHYPKLAELFRRTGRKAISGPGNTAVAVFQLMLPWYGRAVRLDNSEDGEMGNTVKEPIEFF